ncbi:MAG TPA: spore cortex-lytic enzyme [Candidatus Deferrimicrobium sp.]|nr:spore cortex-lytic enzyme [Candidatus Deferrimicrobium sp.]
MLKGKLKLVAVISIAIMLSLTLTLTLQAALGDRNLNRGDTGQEVKELQTKLNQVGQSIKVDGVYGRNTENAVRAFQRGHGLKADGVAGKKTIDALKKATAGSTNKGGKAVGSNSKDLNLLAHAVTGEARGEPYQGKVAVAAVILNRIKDSRFPKTIAGIIYQPGAFSSVSDGQINLQPDADAIKAAREAMNGSDPSHGAVFFFAPEKTTNRFVWSRPQICKIGKHIFTK